MSATVQAQYYNGAAGVGADATTGIRFNREDTQMGTGGSIPIPVTSNVTFFSWHKSIALTVTVADASGAISNRSIKLGTNVNFPTGAFMYFLSTPNYRQATLSNAPPTMTANAAVPSDPTGDGSYALLTTAPQVFDTTPHTGGSTGRNGNFCRLVFGIDARYTGGPGSLTLPNVIVGYDES